MNSGEVTQIQVTFSQPQIKTGEFKKVLKVFSVSATSKALELSWGEFNNQDDYVGLIDCEPEPQLFFEIDK